MKKALIIGLMGVLIRSEVGLSLTGKVVYTCTYSVSGQEVTVVLPYVCPGMMQFQ